MRGAGSGQERKKGALLYCLAMMHLKRFFVL